MSGAKHLLLFYARATQVTLSLRSSNLITAAGMRHFTNLVNLKSLDLERCPLIQGGFVYLKDTALHALLSRRTILHITLVFVFSPAFHHTFQAIVGE